MYSHEIYNNVDAMTNENSSICIRHSVDTSHPWRNYAYENWVIID